MPIVMYNVPAPTVLLGGAGAICAASHVCTQLFATMIQAALAGDVVTTRRLAMLLHPVVEAGFAEPNPAVFKTALHVLGRIPWPHLRAPMAEATPAATRWLLDAIHAAAT